MLVLSVLALCASKRMGCTALDLLYSSPFCSVGQTTSPEDIFSIASFSDLNVVLGFPGTLTCAARVIVNGAQVTYSIVKDSNQGYLTAEL